MKTVIFADQERECTLRKIFNNIEFTSKAFECEFYKNYDDFIRKLPKSKCDVVIVAYKSATGMQGVRAAMLLLRNVPVVWFSDDNGFVEESYRMGCSFFSAEEITIKTISTALKMCVIEGRK